MPPATTTIAPVVPDQIARGDGARLIANPLREGLRLERIPEPCTMVICGATGDLTVRKLGPALYNLMLGGFLPPEFSVVGFARRCRDLDQSFPVQARRGPHLDPGAVLCLLAFAEP